MITVERVSRILYNFRMGVTEDNVLRLLRQGLLEEAPNLNSISYVRTKYNFSINTESLVKLLYDRGLSEKEINSVLSA